MIKRNKLITIAALVLLLILPLAVSAADRQDVINITVLTVNDFHGMLSEQGKNPGLAKVAGFLHDQRTILPNTLIVSAGDMFQGSADSNLLYGKTVVEAMNTIGFAAMAVGNHEFDWGLARLTKIAGQAKFPFLAANVIDTDTGDMLSSVKKYMITEIDGIKIGVVGLSTPETAYKSNPKVVGKLRFEDPAVALKPIIEELKNQDVTVIIVLSHLGCEQDAVTGEISGEAAELAKNIDGVDLIIAGHTHRSVAGSVNGIPLLQAKYWGRAAGKASLAIDRQAKKVVNALVEVIDLSPAELHENPEVVALIEKDKAELQPVKQQVLGWLAAPLPHDRFTLSPLGQWTTDVMREASHADIAFQNGGGLRTGISAGPVTLGLLYEVTPFDNTIYTLDMTGGAIKDVLEYGIKNDNIGTVQFSGVRVVYDGKRPLGSRVVEIRLTGGGLLQPDRYYKVAINDFLAAGGDGYTMFLKGRGVQDTFIPLRDVFADALRRAKKLEYQEDGRLRLISGRSHVGTAA